MYISKSVLDLDAAADAFLKSQTAKKSEDDNKEKNDMPEPDEISDVAPEDEPDDSPDDNVAPEDEPEKNTKKSVKKGLDCDVNDFGKCDTANGDNTVGSGKALNKDDEIEEDSEDDDEVEKSKDNPHTTDDFKALAKSFNAFRVDNSSAINVLAKSLNAMMTSNQLLQEENSNLRSQIQEMKESIDNKFDDIQIQLAEFSSQPAHLRKSLASSVEVHDRNFNTSVNGGTGFEDISKSQVLDVLNTELFSGNTSITPQDIIGFESGAPLRQELRTLVMNKIG